MSFEGGEKRFGPGRVKFYFYRACAGDKLKINLKRKGMRGIKGNETPKQRRGRGPGVRNFQA